METVITNLSDIINHYTSYDFYIGQTNNPKTRLKQHNESKNFLFMIVIYESSKDIIDILEYSLINKYKTFDTNMNNQIYPDNEKLEYITKIQIPDINTVKDKHYLYLAFPFSVDIITDYIDVLTVIPNKNGKIKILSSLHYATINKENKTSEEICETRINDLINQYRYKYRKMKIRTTKGNFKLFKIKEENKDNIVKMIYKNSNIDLIKQLNKQFNDKDYNIIFNDKMGILRKIKNKMSKHDIIYIKFFDIINV